MSVNQDVFKALLDMGIDAPLARAASARFGAADAAVNWCFSDAGASWTPDDDKKEQKPEYATPGATVTHHEVYDQSGQSSMSNSPNPFHSPSKQTQQSGQAAPPPMPPRRANLATLPSNNPFRNNPPPPDASTMDDDEDEDLRKALAMSRGDIADDTAAEGKDGEDEGRHERERSVRASGVPPPSPEGQDMSKAVVFGPTEKDDPEGKMSLVPGTPGPVNNISKEDEELNRAIQDSLMTASFHSASAAQDADKPVQGVRQPGAPQVLYSQSGSSTYAANYLQGLLAIPQFREAIVASQYTERGDAKLYTNLMNLQSLIEQQKSDPADFIEVDQTLRELRNGSEPNQLPPANPAVDFHTQMTVFANDVLCTARATGAFDGSLASAAYIDDPTALFTSKVMSAPVDRPTFLNVYRGSDPANRQLLGAFAGIMWGADHPNAAIEAFSDIIMIRLGWEWAAPKELWQLEERVVLDRFTKENATRSFQIRAAQAAASGEARRVKEKIDKLSNHNGESTIESLRVLVKHYESAPASDDQIQNESRREMKAKLAGLLADLEMHRAALDEQLAKHEKAQSPAAFDSDDPELNQHAYVLRAVLFHDGITVPGQHLFAYIKHEDGTWWKVQEHKATQVDFATMAGDRTGLFMEGGPYMLLYSRDGPRPAPPVPSIDEESVDAAPPALPQAAPSTSQDTVKPDEDDLSSFDETPPNERDATHEQQPEA